MRTHRQVSLLLAALVVLCTSAPVAADGSPSLVAYNLSAKQVEIVAVTEYVVEAVATDHGIPAAFLYGLWYKENSLSRRAATCEGLLGFHTLATSGAYYAGWATDTELRFQLTQAAKIVNAYCPYLGIAPTQDEIRACYLAYNTGKLVANADRDGVFETVEQAAQAANESAYVMNGASPEHRNMPLYGVDGTVYYPRTAGAWVVYRWFIFDESPIKPF